MASGSGDGWKGADAAWQVTGLMMAGIAVWGGTGFLLDRWMGFDGLFLPIGMIIGAGTSIYLVYLKHGRQDPEA